LSIRAATLITALGIAFAAFAPDLDRPEPRPCPAPAPSIPTAPREYTEADVLAAIREGSRP
jgi:hypothetical protein